MCPQVSEELAADYYLREHLEVQEARNRGEGPGGKPG
jgi:hypothetical protein